MTVIIMRKTMMIVIENHKGGRSKIMGVPRQQATRNRQAIIDTAARVFRERGVDGVGVADLMKEAGFTHGGFYNHFDSKDALAAEACAAAFAAGAGTLNALIAGDPTDRSRAFQELMDSYLTVSQVDSPGCACPTATLAVDAARHGKGMQAAYADGVGAFLDALTVYFVAEGQTQEAARQTAVATLANLVGTMVVARGVGAADPALSAELLEEGRRNLPAKSPPQR